MKRKNVCFVRVTGIGMSRAKRRCPIHLFSVGSTGQTRLKRPVGLDVTCFRVISARPTFYSATSTRFHNSRPLKVYMLHMVFCTPQDMLVGWENVPPLVTASPILHRM